MLGHQQIQILIFLVLVAIEDREISSRFVEDGSYIRLKNIALGYNLPSDITEKLGVDNVRLSVSAQNLLTFTNYSGLDPEVSYFGSGGQDSSDQVIQLKVLILEITQLLNQ